MVELIPKAKRPRTKYPVSDILFKVSAGLVIAAAILYGAVFVIHYKRQKTLVDINERIRNLLGSKEQKIFDDIAQYNEQIERAKEVAKGTVKPLAVISMIENSIHPKVRIISFTSSFAEKRAVMALEAESLPVFWEQMRSFRKSAYIEKIDVTNFVLGKRGEVHFGVAVFFIFSADVFVWGQGSS